MTLIRLSEGGIFRGEYSSLTVGSSLRKNDTVLQDALLYSRNAAGTVEAVFDEAQWTLLRVSVTSEDITDYAAVTGSVAQTLPYRSAVNSTIPITSGRLYVARGDAVLVKGNTLSSITFLSGDTSGASGSNAHAGATHQWFAAFNANDYSRIGITADATNEAWLTNRPKTLALTTPYTATETIPILFTICVVATTMPYLFGGATPATAQDYIPPMKAGQSTPSVTDPASCPVSADVPSTQGAVPMAWGS